jgi:hypothetical protein
LKPEIEIYLAKFYRRPQGEGWRFSILEIINFDNDATWCLFELCWHPREAPKRLTFHLL